MAAELHALLPHLADRREREDLKSARIRQDGAVPSHEAVHAAELLEQVDPRPEHQVVGVAEDDLGTERDRRGQIADRRPFFSCDLRSAICDLPRAELLQLFGREALHRGQGADRHEYRRFDDAMGRGHSTAACGAVGVQKVEAEAGRLHRVAQAFQPVPASERGLESPRHTGGHWIFICST